MSAPIYRVPHGAVRRAFALYKRDVLAENHLSRLYAEAVKYGPGEVPDLDHWKLFFDGDYGQAVADGEVSLKADYYVHMMNAYIRGDRFIVAKLSYDGGSST